MKKTERIHSLDSLRAIMMLLGLVLHSTETYLVSENFPWPKDGNATSYVLQYIENFIHMFRMPVFFVMGGFFAGLLFYEKGSRKMMKNRIFRIGLPFLVFLSILTPIILFCLTYSHAVFSGNENALNNVISRFSFPDNFIPPSTFHLWFLYYLIFTTLVTFLLAKVLEKLPKITFKIKRVTLRIFKNPLKKVLWVTLGTFLLLVLNWELNGPTPLSFTFDYKAFLFYFFFYILGWLLYKLKEVLDSFLKYNQFYIGTAIVLFSLVFFLNDEIDVVIKGVLSALEIALLVFGLIGTFIKLFHNYSSRMRYISDASYWVYLVHLPFTIIIPAFIVSWNLPGIIKFFITVSITIVICFASYHYLVRSTFIGKFLNGRKY